MPRSKTTSGSLIHRDRQGGTIPFFDSFSESLKCSHQFTVVAELYQSCLSLLRSKDFVVTVPSMTTFARMMARQFRQQQIRVKSITEHKLIAEKM